MKLFTRKNGSTQYTPIETNNRPIRIKINGVQFEISEQYGMLKINQIEGQIVIRPYVSNVVYLDPIDGKEKP
jgi:hypothetical protein